MTALDLDAIRADVAETRERWADRDEDLYGLLAAAGRLIDHCDALVAAVAEAQRERDEWRATVRRAMAAIKDGATTAGSVALAICSYGDGKPDIFDDLAAARAEVERMRHPAYVPPHLAQHVQLARWAQQLHADVKAAMFLLEPQPPSEARDGLIASIKSHLAQVEAVPPWEDRDEYRADLIDPVDAGQP